MFDVFYIGSKPNLFPHEQVVGSIEEAQKLSKTRYCWVVNYLLDYSDFDFLWEPVPWQNEYTHVWPSNYHQYSGTYLVPKTGQIQYHFQNKVIPSRHRPNDFETLVPGTSFDYTWHPHPLDPPYIYVFGNQWWSAEKMPTIEYHVPGATERKYIDMPTATLPQRHDNRWHTREDCEWDYSWVPDPGDPPYIYVFGNQHWPAEVMSTVEYHVPGATERKFMDWPRAMLLPDPTLWTVPEGLENVDLSWVPNPGAPAYIYQFGTQHQKTGGPVYTMSGATETNYIDYPRVIKTTVDPYWTVPQGVAPDSFDWTWHPDATELPYIYQFATQHQKTGGPVYTVPGATEVKYLEHIEVKIQSKTVPIVEIDHMDGNAGKIPGTIKKVRYFDNYRDTLLRLAKTLVGEHEFVWVCSSVCDYTDFDFTWHPEKWQSTMLHVFASNDQKFGDTFYMHVPTFAERAEKKALLEWYSVNFVTGKSVPRWPLKHIVHSEDTHVNVVLNNEVTEPLTIYSTGAVPNKVPTVPLWREETKTIVPLDSAASAVIVPRVAKPFIKTQLYDYPYIDKTHRKTLTAQPQDIVFISYDEPESDRNWEILHSKFPQSHRVHGVAGMELALEAAANVSTTPWYWAVFAKTELAPEFDFSFVPDYMQQPKHYVFNCRNMVNGLEYGHMGMVLYNCAGVRELNRRGEFGLDYTLSFPHESVPVLSCLGRFNTTPYHTWRTAFRETAKLAYFESEQNTVEGQYRLRTWLEHAEGNYAEWCLRGAQDGREFFETTGGNLKELKQSFRWEWLREYFRTRYGELD